MKIIGSLAVCSTLLLSACVSLSQDQQTTQASMPVHYHCESGKVITVYYPSTDSATIQYKDNTYTMKIAVSASGARYVGEDLEWWTKGAGTGSYGSLVHHNADGTSGDTIEMCAES